MSGRYLLDTNIVIAIFARDNAVMEALAGAEEVFIPSIVLGELYFGAHKSAHKKANIAIIDQFASSTTVLACDTETARHYGTTKDHLRSKGRPIPENDLWIASIALQHHLSLISRDQHFHEIKGLTVKIW